MKDTAGLIKVFTDAPEKEYINSVPHSYRKKLGQFFTPLPVAELMTEWVIHSERSVEILDPAVGSGIFFRTIIKNHPDRIKNIQFTGYEIDVNIIENSKNLFSGISGSNVQILNRNYLFNDWEAKYDGVICNPPYLKFHDYEPKDLLLNMFEKKLNVKLSGFTNIYTLFILKSIHQLRDRGRIACIVPSEFLNSNYGKNIKEFIKKSGTLRFVIAVDSNLNIFEDATTTSSILLFAKDENTETVEFINVKNLKEMELVKQHILSYPENGKMGNIIRTQELDETQKWRIYYQNHRQNRYRNLVPFSKYAKVSRGIATGANDYFTFSENKRIKYGIKKKFLLPCLIKASYARKHFFTDGDFDELRKKDKPVYLLNATDLSDENLKRYIEYGERQGVHRRYLTAHRIPWYTLENRPPAQILVTVFNRSEMRFVRNEAGVYNLTAFHCVYLKADVVSEIDLLMAYLITDVAQEIFDNSRREYGGGLKKFEPSDLSTSLVVDLNKIDMDEKKEILCLFSIFRQNEINDESTVEAKSKLNEIFTEIIKR